LKRQAQERLRRGNEAERGAALDTGEEVIMSG
jgi:hypothetical protein